MRLRQTTHTQLRVGGLRSLGCCHRLEVGVDHVDAHPTTIGKSRDQGAKRLRGAAGTADHTTEVFGVHAHLKNLATL